MENNIFSCLNFIFLVVFSLFFEVGVLKPEPFADAEAQETLWKISEKVRNEETDDSDMLWHAERIVQVPHLLLNFIQGFVCCFLDDKYKENYANCVVMPHCNGMLTGTFISKKVQQPKGLKCTDIPDFLWRRGRWLDSASLCDCGANYTCTWYNVYQFCICASWGKVCSRQRVSALDSHWRFALNFFVTSSFAGCDVEMSWTCGRSDWRYHKKEISAGSLLKFGVRSALWPF